jgi:CheY-like chemotaxis protein
LAEGFNDAGFETLNVSDGSAALESVKKFKPNVIILDLILPGIDDFEVLKELKIDDETANIPVIVASNLDSAPDVKSAKAL